MKRGIWISLVPGVIALSASLTLLLILANWTYFLLLKWPPVLWLLSLYGFSLACFFPLNKWATTFFEALTKRDRNILTIALGVYSLFVFLNQFPEFQSTFTTWATLILAGTAAISIVTGIEQAKRNERIRIKERRENERLRKEDREENERLRKEDREEYNRLLENERQHALEANIFNKFFDSTKQLHDFISTLGYPRNIEKVLKVTQDSIDFNRNLSVIKKYGLIFDNRLDSSIEAVIARLCEFIDFMQSKTDEVIPLPEEQQFDALAKAINESNFDISVDGNVRSNLCSASEQLLVALIALQKDLKI